MKRTLVSAAAVAMVAFAASTAFADFQYAFNAALENAPNATQTTSDGGTLAHALSGAPDGVTATYTDTGPGGNVYLRFDFATAPVNPGLILYGIVATGTVTITEVRWSSNTTYEFTDPQTSVINPGGSAVVPTTVSDFAVLTSIGGYDNGGFVPGTYTSVFVKFVLNSNATLTLDAISNPEPGTMALFALGAAGLGGFAWRRRRTGSAAKRPA